MHHFPSVCQEMTPDARQHLTSVQAEQRVQPVHILEVFQSYIFHLFFIFIVLYKFFAQLYVSIEK